MYKIANEDYVDPEDEQCAIMTSRAEFVRVGIKFRLPTASVRSHIYTLATTQKITANANPSFPDSSIWTESFSSCRAIMIGRSQRITETIGTL